MDPIGEISFTLKAGGFWWYRINKNPIKAFIQILQQIILIVGLILNAYCISRNGFKESMSGALIFLTPAILVPVCHTVLFFKRNQMKILLESFEIILSKNHDIRENFAHNYQLVFKGSKLWRYILLAVWAIFYILPLVIETIFYLAGFKEFPVRIPSIIDKFFEKKGRLQNYIYGLANAMWGVAAMWSHFGFVITSLSILTYFYVELKIFRYQIDNHYCNQLLTDKHSTFKEIISRQQEIIRLLQEMKNAMALPLGVQNTFISLCICYGLYTLTSNDSTEAKILFAYAFLLFLSDASICCYAGDLIESEGTAIVNSLYNLPWYTLQPKDRKATILIILQGSQSTKIEYKGTSANNLESLLTILQATYSYFMLLKSI